MFLLLFCRTILNIFTNLIIPKICVVYMCSFIKLNQGIQDTVCQYSAFVPAWLRNRPAVFQRHCLKRLRRTANMTAESVVPVGDNSYHVFVPETKRVFLVDLSHDYHRMKAPRCDCRDWTVNNYPCKHILGVLLFVPDVNWNCLPLEYSNCPLFSQFDSCDMVAAVVITGDVALGEHENTTLKVSNADSMSTEGIQAPGANVEQLRLNTRQDLRRLSDMTYNIDDTTVLAELNKSVKSILQRLNNEVPRSSFKNLLLRSKSKQRVARVFRHQSQRTNHIRKLKPFKDRHQKKMRRRRQQKKGLKII